MTPEECVVLTAYIEELCPNQKIGENTPDFWHDVLYRYPLDDCRAAVAAMVNDGRIFIDVARIAVDAKRIRDGRLANIDLDTQPPGPVDELTYRNALRQITHQVADGQPPPFKAIEAGRGERVTPQGAQAYKDLRAAWDAEQKAKKLAAQEAGRVRQAAAVAENRARQDATLASAALLLLTDEASIAAYKAARDELGPDAPRDRLMVRAAELADHTQVRPVADPSPEVRSAKNGCRRGCSVLGHEKPCPHADADSPVGRVKERK